jgi:hypothetical protein
MVISQDHEGNGEGAFWWLMLIAAGTLGFALDDRRGLLGAALGVAPFVLSPWTAPRGDGDGLWLLYIPMLAGFVLVLSATSSVMSLLRRRVRDGR